jgi:hypothetical protein
MPSTPISRSDSGYALQVQQLREKRSGHFETSSRRSSSFGFERVPPLRRPSQPFLGHGPSASTSSLSHELRAGSSYAPSVYAQSTLAASTIMPGMAMQPVRNTSTTQWQEGHCLQWRPHEDKAVCSICEEKSDDGLYRCTGKFSVEEVKRSSNMPQAAQHMLTANALTLSASYVPQLSDQIRFVRRLYDASLACCTRIVASWFLRLASARRRE